MPVGLRTNDDLNIFVAEDGTYHFTYYERGKLGFDRIGSLDDLLYWYCQSVISSQAAERVGDRAERFRYEYQVLSELSVDWAKRNVRETADMFRKYGKPPGYCITSRHWRTPVVVQSTGAAFGFALRVGVIASVFV